MSSTVNVLAVSTHISAVGEAPTGALESDALALGDEIVGEIVEGEGAGAAVPDAVGGLLTEPVGEAAGPILAILQ
jgi:hypothetical protein